MPGGYLTVPHYLQEFSWSCVPACARMVLAYHGVEVEELELCRILHTIPTVGTAARDLSRLSRLGFNVDFDAMDDAAIRKAFEVGKPPIAFVRTGSLAHWPVDEPHAVVVVGFDDSTVFLNDPGSQTPLIKTSPDSFTRAREGAAWLAAILSPER